MLQGKVPENGLLARGGQPGLVDRRSEGEEQWVS